MNPEDYMDELIERPKEIWRERARAAIGAVAAYRAEHDAQAAAMNTDWWNEPPREGEA
jgi:hypothetical protein